MSLKIDRVQLDIVINNDQARQSLRKLEGEYKDLAKEQKKIAQGTDDWERVKQQMFQVKAKMDKVYESIGIANLSMKELSSRQKELNSALAAMSPSMKGYAELKAEADAVGKRLAGLKSKAKGTDFSIGKMADGFNKYFAVVTAGVASLTALIFSMKQAVEESNKFEQSVANLSAITGLVGDDLKWMADKAKELSVSTTESGVRITKSAIDIVDGFKLMGSARPELLKDKDALALVTENALILSEAAGIGMTEAVDAVSASMNQFNLNASESGKVINAIAAGSLEGSAEVGDLTQSLKNVGAVANDSNMSLEQTVSALEVLGEKQLKGEEAGTKLRGALLKLKDAGVGYASGQFVLRDALIDVNKQLDSRGSALEKDAVKQKVFGIENVTAGTILLQNIDKYDKLNVAVTGTNVAFDQAKTATETNSAKLEQAKNRVELLTIEFGQKLAPAMTFSTNAFGAFMRVMLAAPGFVREYNIALIALAGALIAYNGNMIKGIAVKVIDNLMLEKGIGLKVKDAVVTGYQAVKEQLLTIWRGNGTIAAKLMTTAQYGLNAAMAANPIGFMITAITALVIAIKTYDKYNSESMRLEQEKATAINNVKAANDLLQKAYEDQQVALSAINKLSAEQKKVLLEQFDATVKQAEAELTLAKAKQINIEKENAKTSLWQKFTNAVIANGNPAVLAAREASDAVLNGIDASATMNDGIVGLMDSIKQLKSQSGDLNEIVNGEKLADEITGKSITQLEEKQRYLTSAQKNYEKGSADFIRISKKLSEVSKQLYSDVDSGGGAAKEVADSIQELNKQISDIDTKINNAITSGNIPLAEKFQKEKESLELLAETYKAVKEEIAKGWDVNQRDLGDVKMLTSIGTKLVTGSPDKKDKSPLVKINTGIAEATPEQKAQAIRDNVAAEEMEAAAEHTKWQNAAFEGASIAEDAIFTMRANKRQADFDKSMNLLEKKRNAELSNANLTEVQKTAINAKYDKQAAALKLKNFKKQQNASALQAIINGVLSISKTFAELGWPAGIPAAAISAAATIAQVAIIKSTPPPEYAKGRYDVTGASGASYKNLPYMGEAKTGVYTHPAIIGETGGELIVDAPTTRNIMMNYPEIMAAIQHARIPQYSSGRYPADQSRTKQAITDPVANNTEMISALKDFSAAVRYLKTNGVHLDYQKLKDMQTKDTNAENSTAM